MDGKVQDTYCEARRLDSVSSFKRSILKELAHFKKAQKHTSKNTFKITLLTISQKYKINIFLISIMAQ